MSVERLEVSSERLRRGDPEPDLVDDAMDRLMPVLPAREDSTILVELLEDDLRQGLAALEDVESHFHDIMDTLDRPRLSPLELLAAGDAARVMPRLEVLQDSVARLQKRLSLAAARMRMAGVRR